MIKPLIKTNLALLVSSIFLYGCATYPITRVDPLADFHATKPNSILVLPILNNSIEVLAGESALTTLPMLLGEQGYYVFPVHTVKTLLESEGLYSAAEIHQQPSATLSELFGADAILYVTIHSWAAYYIVLKTHTEVDLEYRITDASGLELYHAREEVSFTSGSANNEEASLLEQAIFSMASAAIERAAPKYLELAREANHNAFIDNPIPLPPGPYSPNYHSYYTSGRQSNDLIFGVIEVTE